MMRRIAITLAAVAAAGFVAAGPAAAHGTNGWDGPAGGGHAEIEGAGPAASTATSAARTGSPTSRARRPTSTRSAVTSSADPATGHTRLQLFQNR